MYILKLSDSVIEEHPKYKNSKSPIVKSFWQTVFHFQVSNYQANLFFKYNLHLVKQELEKQEFVLPPELCSVIDWIA